MGIGEDVVIGFFFKQTAGINKLGVGGGFVFRQHQNIHRDRSAIE